DADAAAAEARVDREAPGLGDAMWLADPLERDAAGRLAVRLDHEPAVRLGLALRSLDVGERVLARVGGAIAEERPRLLARDQVDEEVDVVRPDAAERD